jgi:hypothetical protein
VPTGSCRAAVAAGVACLTCASSLLAASPERDVAREIARTGASYYDDGAWEKARDHFHRAYQLVPAPTLALMEARALVRLGRLVEALAVYEVAATRAADASNDAYRKAATDAAAELDQLRARVPKLSIALPNERGLRVRVDGAVISDTDVRGPLAVDPGTHLVELQSDGESRTWAAVALREGDHRVVQLELSADDRTRAAAAVARHRRALWSAVMLGSAGMLVGVTSGALAAHQAAKPEPCEPSCGPRFSSSVDPANGWRTVSITGYALGLAGLGTGAVLFATLPPARISAQLGAFVSAAGLGLEVAGSF